MLGEVNPVPVRGFLCFVATDWPLIGGSFTTRGVSVLWPKKLASLILEPGVLCEDEIAATHDAWPPRSPSPERTAGR